MQNSNGNGPTDAHATLRTLLSHHQRIIGAAGLVLAEIPTTSTIVHETLADLCVQHERSIGAIQIVLDELAPPQPTLTLEPAPVRLRRPGRKPTSREGRRAWTQHVLDTIRRAGRPVTIGELGGPRAGVPALIRYGYVEKIGDGFVLTDKVFTP